MPNKLQTMQIDIFFFFQPLPALPPNCFLEDLIFA